jgi:phage-related tail fiber protein
MHKRPGPNSLGLIDPGFSLATDQFVETKETAVVKDRKSPSAVIEPNKVRLNDLPNKAERPADKAGERKSGERSETG